MYVCVCVCVCIYVSVYICIYVYIYMFMCVNIYMCVDIYVCVYIYMLCICVCIYIYVMYAYIYIYIFKMIQIIKTVKTQQSTQNYTNPMTTKSMVKSAWAKNMGQFIYHLDPNTRKITRSLEKMKLKIINGVLSSLTKLAQIIYIYIYIYMCVCVCVCVYCLIRSSVQIFFSQNYKYIFLMSLFCSVHFFLMKFYFFGLRRMFLVNFLFIAYKLYPRMRNIDLLISLYRENIRSIISVF